MKIRGDDLYRGVVFFDDLREKYLRVLQLVERKSGEENLWLLLLRMLPLSAFRLSASRSSSRLLQEPGGTWVATAHSASPNWLRRVREGEVVLVEQSLSCQILIQVILLPSRAKH